jgi:hypothetical protein
VKRNYLKFLEILLKTHTAKGVTFSPEPLNLMKLLSLNPLLPLSLPPTHPSQGPSYINYSRSSNLGKTSPEDRDCLSFSDLSLGFGFSLEIENSRLKQFLIALPAMKVPF